tara:strand:+ start:462 stop:1232 length:771 start_codon:yes stop_codon:yes gene_type:complete
LLALPLTGLAQADSFDLMGLKPGMPIEEFEPRAKDIADDRVQVTQLGIASPLDGSIVEGTVYVSDFSFYVDGSLFEATATSEPMAPEIYEISRFVSYYGCGQGSHEISRCQDLGPEFPVFKQSLIDKYGEPVWQQEKRGLKGQEVQFLFADGDFPDTCRDQVTPIVAHGSFRQLRWGVPSDYATSDTTKNDTDSCPALLHVRMEYLRRVDQPTLQAMFVMKDIGLEGEYDATYDPYWSKWMDENFSRTKNTEKPVL